MNDESLFGNDVEAAGFQELATERAGSETTENALTPTIILSFMVCPALTALSYAYSC